MILEAEDRLAEIKQISSTALGSNPGKHSTEHLDALRESVDDLLGIAPDSIKELEAAQIAFAEQAAAEADAWWDYLKKQQPGVAE